jgi:polyisoprenoid-binding protein YceI
VSLRARALAPAIACAGALWLAACHAPPGSREPHAAPSAAPLTAHPAVVARYRVDPEHSQVLISVFRDGPLAALGHDHLIAVRALDGRIALPADPALATFELEFPVEALLVDDPALRAAAGPAFQASIDAASIQGTRNHMLGGTLLDAAHYPRIRLESRQIRAEGDHWLVQASIVVRGHEDLAVIPVSLALSGDTLAASGEFDLDHAELGLTPYSVALGALKVAERMHVRYQLLARRQPSGTGSDQQ